MLPKKLKLFNVYIDGKGYQGEAQEITLPKLTRKMEEYRGGGMIGPIKIDLGQEELTCEITMGGTNIELMAMFSACNNERAMLRFMGSAEADDNCDDDQIEISMRGRWSEIDMGNWKAGDDTSTKYTGTLSYYKLTIDSIPVIEIDYNRSICMILGYDSYAKHRKNIGLSW